MVSRDRAAEADELRASIPPASAGMHPAILWSLCLLGLLAISVYVFRDQWSGRASFPYDFPEGYYGISAYWITSIQSGEWPQWIPYQSMGYPALMNPQIGIFYPPFWSFVLLHIPYTLQAANVFQVLHVVFGGAGVLLLAYRMFGSLAVAQCGAAAFLFFGGFYTNAEHPDFVRGFAWVPWLFAAALLPETSRELRWRGRAFVTRLGTLNLVLPVLVACFITGAYTGQMIAGLTMLAVFLLAQAVQRASAAEAHKPPDAALNERGTRRTWLRLASLLSACSSRDKAVVLRDSLALFVLIGLGVLMTAAFLLPEFYLTRELTRVQGASESLLWLMVARNWFDLIFPSSMVHAGWDYSMYGMQLPITLWIFLGLARREALRKVVPFFAPAAAAIVLSFAIFRPLGRVIWHVFPVLGLSRFVAGDYRQFLYLPVLLLTLAGLAVALKERYAPWRTAALALSVLVLLSLVSSTFLQHDLVATLFKPFFVLMKQTVWMGLAGIAAFGVASRFRKPAILAVLLPVITVAAMMPVVNDMKVFWSDPHAIQNLYTNQGFSLAPKGRLSTFQIFDHMNQTRPARKTAANREWLSWRGYLDGTYMTDDPGGSVSLSRAKIASDPHLLRFMQQENKIVGEACGSAVCSSDPAGIAVGDLPPVGRSVEYGRNDVRYEVSVPQRSLLVENEIYIAGWHAMCDGKPVHVERVDGALRGFVIPAGQHRLKLYYRTPFLKAGLMLSTITFLCWVTGLGFFIRS